MVFYVDMREVHLSIANPASAMKNTHSTALAHLLKYIGLNYLL
jgi:hypothetical protein